MPKRVIQLSIEPEEMLRYYKGNAQSVIAPAENGQTIRFPAHYLRPFVEANGIHGRFVIEYSQDGKLQSIEKL